MKIRLAIIKSNWMMFDQHGWGNGYVGVSKDHPWYGKDYDSINAHVHGGLTFSNLGARLKGRKAFLEGAISKHLDLWWVGFDTAHYDDNQINWPRGRVFRETLRLYWQAVIAIFRKEK